MPVNAPAKWDLEVFKGAALHKRLAVVNVDNTPRNLTGFSAKMMIRADVDDAVAALTLTSGAGLTIDPANGYVDIRISKTQSAAFTIQSGVWDLWIDDTSIDSPEYLAGGGVTIRKLVTQ